MRDLLPSDRPALVLAPMQDVTDLPFMRVVAARGGADWYVTEYFRVHPTSRLDPWVLRSLDENPTGKPIFAQMIGHDIESLTTNARELMKHPIAGVDINLGCPAPIVCRKDAGGGLLRDLSYLDRLLGALREAIDGRFTVKTRVGYYDPSEFEALIALFAKHSPDGLTIHGRTVMDRYATPVHPECVRHAVEALPFPVIANGNVVDVATGLGYLRRTGAAGLMLGRGAIRNPWLFDQLRAAWAGKPLPRPTHRDLLEYIFALHDETAREMPTFKPVLLVRRMKKTLVYIAQGLNEEFEYKIRRVETPEEFRETCCAYLDHDTPLPHTPPTESKLFCGFADLSETPVADS